MCAITTLCAITSSAITRAPTSNTAPLGRRHSTAWVSTALHRTALHRSSLHCTARLTVQCSDARRAPGHPRLCPAAPASCQESCRGRGHCQGAGGTGHWQGAGGGEKGDSQGEEKEEVGREKMRMMRRRRRGGVGTGSPADHCLASWEHHLHTWSISIRIGEVW